MDEDDDMEVETQPDEKSSFLSFHKVETQPDEKSSFLRFHNLIQSNSLSAGI